MIDRMNYEMGAVPNKFTLGVGKVEYNVHDKKMYTIDKFGAVVHIRELLISPDGTEWILSVTNAGVLTAVKL